MLAGLAGHFHLQRIIDRRFHLRGDKALPDQVIELEHGGFEIRLDLLRLTHDRRRPDGFMRFLRADRLGLILRRLGRQKIIAILLHRHNRALPSARLGDTLVESVRM